MCPNEYFSHTCSFPAMRYSSWQQKQIERKKVLPCSRKNVHQLNGKKKKQQDDKWEITDQKVQESKLVLTVQFILHNIVVIGLCLSHYCFDTLGLLSLFLTVSHRDHCWMEITFSNPSISVLLAANMYSRLR